MPLITVSEISFDGAEQFLSEPSAWDTNGQLVTPNIVGGNSIKKDGSGNGVFFLDSAEGGLALSMDMLSEPVTADTDLLDKDFEITFTDFQMTCAGVLWVVIPFIFGNWATGNGYVVQRVMTEGAFWVYKITGGVPADTNVYTDPVGFSLLAKHTYKIKRESGVISFLIDNVASTKTASALDGQTWDSYAGTGQICFGNVYDVGRDLTLTLGNFEIKIYGEAPATYSVTYNGNGSDGGAVPVDATEYEEGDSITVLGNTGSLVKSGYTFDGWNTSADGSGTDYDSGDAFLMGSANVTLYAQWSEDEPEPTPVPRRLFLKNVSLSNVYLSNIMIEGSGLGVNEILDEEGNTILDEDGEEILDET